MPPAWAACRAISATRYYGGGSVQRVATEVTALHGLMSFLRHSVWNSIHKESMKIFSWSSSSPFGRQIGHRSEPVTNLRIGYKIFRRGGVIAELLS